jgi:hypothetical protein
LLLHWLPLVPFTLGRGQRRPGITAGEPGGQASWTGPAVDGHVALVWPLDGKPERKLVLSCYLGARSFCVAVRVE